MGLLKKDISLDLKEIKKAYNNKKDAEDFIKSQKIMADKKLIEDIKDSAAMRVIKYQDFKENVKLEALHTALTRICENSIRNITDTQKDVLSNIMESYIREKGMYTILRKMRNSKNLLLRELADDVKNTSEELIDGASVDAEDDYTINKDTIDDFIKDIDKNEDIKDVTNIIRLRVSNAEEDFMNRNEQDNENIKTILKDTAARVKNAKEENDNDYSDAVEESEMRIASKQIYHIQHESRNSVFDRITTAVAKNCLLNNANESMVKNNHLNMEAVIGISKAIYTILEMFSATTLENVDDEFINDTIKSL